MTQFNPTTRITSGDDQPDLLSTAVLNSLTRPLYGSLSWDVLRSFIVTWLTFGVLPMILMIRWLKAFIATQQQQLWHLAEWMRVQSGDPDANELQKASQNVRFNMPLGILSGALLAVAIGAIIAHFADARLSWKALSAFAYHRPTTPTQLVFTLALSAAAVCHWGHLAWHQNNVEHYLRWFNQLLARQSKNEIPLPRLELGLRPPWIIAGVVLAWAGGLWAVPVLLAAGAHRRYIIEGSVRMRSVLAERLRAMLLERRPRMRVPSPIQIVRTCVRPNCRAPLPSDASWCPRCGTKAIRRMDVVA